MATAREEAIRIAAISAEPCGDLGFGGIGVGEPLIQRKLQTRCGVAGPAKQENSLDGQMAGAWGHGLFNLHLFSLKYRDINLFSRLV